MKFVAALALASIADSQINQDRGQPRDRTHTYPHITELFAEEVAWLKSPVLIQQESSTT